MICPNCGSLGAVVVRSVVPSGETDIYCNICCKESSISSNLLRKYTEPMMPKKKEAPPMKVSYNGFAGLLLKLEADITELGLLAERVSYGLEIWDDEKKMKYSFPHANLSGVKFLGGVISFDA